MPAAAQRPLPVDLTGWEVRGTLRGTYATFENHVWTFGPGGRLAGNFSAQVLTTLGRGGSRYIQGRDTGTWLLTPRRLCVQWHRWYGGRRLCWQLQPLQGRWVRFVGLTAAPTFKGTLARR